MAVHDCMVYMYMFIPTYSPSLTRWWSCVRPLIVMYELHSDVWFEDWHCSEERLPPSVHVFFMNESAHSLAKDRQGEEYLFATGKHKWSVWKWGETFGRHNCFWLACRLSRRFLTRIFKVLHKADCASLAPRILHNSLLQSVTGVWNVGKKKKKKKKERKDVMIMMNVELCCSSWEK